MTPQLLRPAATQVDWEFVRGDSFQVIVPVLDAAGQPVTVDGWTAAAQVRRGERDFLLHEWSTAAGNLTMSGTAAVLDVDGSVTAGWAWSDALISIVVIDSEARPHVIARGTLAMLPNPTR